jgi:hypothetical protein
MHTKTIETLVWVLIYAGMVVFGLGVWSVEHSLAVGSSLMLVGGVSVAGGALLVWVRSRRN